MTIALSQHPPSERAILAAPLSFTRTQPSWKILVSERRWLSASVVPLLIAMAWALAGCGTGSANTPTSPSPSSQGAGVSAGRTSPASCVPQPCLTESDGSVVALHGVRRSGSNVTICPTVHNGSVPFAPIALRQQMVLWDEATRIAYPTYSFNGDDWSSNGGNVEVGGGGTWPPSSDGPDRTYVFFRGVPSGSDSLVLYVQGWPMRLPSSFGQCYDPANLI
jgi:hypothetical protein